MTTLFLFAHQDDEFGVFHEIETTIARGERVVCAYLTNGAWKTITPQQRNQESSGVLRRLGVSPADIHFIGTDLELASSTLPDHLDRCWDALVDRCSAFGDIRRIIVHAYEGGHQDHDAAHIVGVILAHRFSILETSRQFPLYRAPGGRVLVTFAAPLPTNGPVERARIPWNNRLRYLALLRCYPSQISTVLKMGPLMAWDYFVDGDQKLQNVSVDRIAEPPHATRLYETWKIYDYARFKNRADRFVATHV